MRHNDETRRFFVINGGRRSHLFVALKKRPRKMSADNFLRGGETAAAEAQKHRKISLGFFAFREGVNCRKGIKAALATTL